MNRNLLIQVRSLGVALALLLPAHAWSYAFVPTESEFATWPPYCQARYVTTDIGRRSTWARTYPSSAVTLWERQIGPASFERVHHYCTGMIWLNRAKRQNNVTTKRTYLNNAEHESLFTKRGLPPNSRISVMIDATLAEIYDEMGTPERAVKHLEDALKQQPSQVRLYGALALLHRKQGNLEKARDTLLRADEIASGQSAELHYNLGLLYLELENTEEALARAKQAYEMGYPLDGLREKLKRLGVWTE